MLRPVLDAILPDALARGSGIVCASATQPVASHTIPAGTPPSDDRAAAEDGWHRCVGWLRGHGVA